MDLPNVYLLHGNFTDEEMNELYNHPKVKAHISLTHGEGFGRPLLEATISQKPVIAPNWSGHLDFLPKNLAVLLGGSLQNVQRGSVPDDMYIEGSQWFTVNYQQASAVIKDVYKNYRKYTLNAKKLGMVNKSKFSLDAMTKELGKILDKYVPEFPKEVKLNLPKLKKILGINSILDLFYVLVGILLFLGIFNINQGHGIGVIIQGGFLLIFDFYYLYAYLV